MSAADQIVTDVERVGGKAASLVRMEAHGLPVPPFFVLSTDVHERAIGGCISEADRESLRQQWEAIGGHRQAVAVRSSAVDEDGSADSFAGIFDTVLDVRGFDALITAVERCWASYDTDASRSYRSARALGHGATAGMGVVVQQMVDARWAGVGFTSDPVRGALSVVTVSATPGLGEDLVSGLVNAEEITVDAQTREVLDRIRPTSAPAFPDHLLERVVELAMEVAALEGFPQDVEWAADGAAAVYLLQSRPVTTVGDIVHNRFLEPWSADPSAAPDAVDRVWSRAFADETWAPPVSPLFYDVQNLSSLVTNQLAKSGDAGSCATDLFKYHRAAAYLDIDAIKRMYRSLPPSMRSVGILNMLPEPHRTAFRQHPWDWRGRLARHLHFEVFNRRDSIRRVHRRLTDAWPEFTRATASWQAVALDSLDDRDLNAFREEIQRVGATIGPDCATAVTYHSVDLRTYLTALLTRWCGVDGERVYAEVSSGLDHSETVAEASAIWRLASKFRNIVGANAIEPMTLQEARVRANDLGLEGAVSELDAFLVTHGHRGANYKDLVYPRWGDDPDLLWQLIRSSARPGEVSPEERHAAAATSRRLRQSQLLQSLSGPQAPLRRLVLRRLMRANEIYAALRDNHRFHYDRVWWAWRRYFLERGRRLVLAGLLADPSDVFFLCRAEINELAGGALSPEIAGVRIRTRQAAWARTRSEQPPKYLRAGYAPFDDVTEDGGDATVLVGLGASPGEAIGNARVVFDAAQLGAVEPGDILVARQTDPGWSPVFARLGGLVLETGGVLAHGASLCREYGLPCVTIVDGATQRITSGDRIRVSGTDATVTVEERTTNVQEDA